MDASISVAPAACERVCGAAAAAAEPVTDREIRVRLRGNPKGASNVSTRRECGALWNQCVRFCRDGTAEAGLAAWGSDANASHLYLPVRLIFSPLKEEQ
ncbi:hypothetical protein L810_6485 [Burkholderia sp. AU4i]|nr:hypothetical protein L810_6485 [Burkholderia sp. AU4i]